jgi:hypothetical protein
MKIKPYARETIPFGSSYSFADVPYRFALA